MKLLSKLYAIAAMVTREELLAVIRPNVSTHKTARQLKCKSFQKHLKRDLWQSAVEYIVNDKERSWAAT